jgi:tetratricopeptide (TPR) repeat protein
MKFQHTALASVLIILTATVSPLALTILAQLETSQVLAQSSTSRKGEADQFLKQGNEQLEKESTLALKSLQRALKIYRELGDLQGEGQALKALGKVSSNRKDYTKAIEYYQQGLAIVPKLNDRKLELDMLNGLGRAYIKLEDYNKAIAIYQKVLVITRESKSGRTADLFMMSREIEPLLMSGVAYSILGNYDKAIEFSQQGLQLAQQFKLPIIRRPVEAMFLPILGISHAVLGDHGKAVEYAHRSLAIAQESQETATGVEKEIWPLIRGLSLFALATAYPYLGEYDKALDYSQQCLKIA